MYEALGIFAILPPGIWDTVFIIIVLDCFERCWLFRNNNYEDTLYLVVNKGDLAVKFKHMQI